MKAPYPENWPQFFTATIAGWKPLLSEGKYKDIIIKSLRYFVTETQVRIQGFVIMSNHFHIIWKAERDFNLGEIETGFKKFTAKRFLAELKNEEALHLYEVNKADRKHQFWKLNSLGIELFTPEAYHQKLNYMHENPVRAGLCVFPEDYKYSSALFYKTGKDVFNILHHEN